ncbi:MAG TPA: tRNA (adenosine(37)-N6)-threonylcarbamoyltransferase complex dimerization subunit type 1 TsaB [Propionibacteriaceae bacterium]|nr:tRNA (adenosine(37)-N6)-threonylcarbamoyltransferase complex dimerization subunit type 1 TsaB [Propionibacteriaceae bacterium]
MSESDSGLWLGIDTSTGVAVSLARPGHVLAARSVSTANVHAEQLMPLVSEVMAESGHALADLAGIVVGIGPGPFTGLRVGIVTAQTLAYVLDVPVRGVCSLDIVALSVAATKPGRGFTVVSDARRKELYWATYDASGRRLDGPSVTLPADVPTGLVVGPGADLYDLAGERRVVALDPGAVAVAPERLPDLGTEPLYLRRPDAQVSTSVKTVLPGRRA